MTTASDQPAILFTAFEPSGDDHAAVVIRELRRRWPDLPIYAWGGPKMATAGATIIAETGSDAVMGVPGFSKIIEHQKINKQIARWLSEHKEVRVHVPVDSPAANFPIAGIARRLRRTVVHLVAPQLWAWGAWRVGKLRRRTDLVLCLLPFEERWFRRRGIPARFIGHPLFDEPIDAEALDAAARSLPGGRHKVALLPGSRPAELRRNFPLLLRTFRDLRARHEGVVGLVGARTEEVRDTLYAHANQMGGWPAGLEIEIGKTDLVARWSDLALVVSGTVMLQVARHGRPMVVVYKVRGFERMVYRMVGRRVITTKYFTLPNLIARQEIVPELVPHFGGYEPLLDRAEDLILSEDRREAQRLNQRAVCAQFTGLSAAAAAADALEERLGLRDRTADDMGGRVATAAADEPAELPRLVGHEDDEEERAAG